MGVILVIGLIRHGHGVHFLKMVKNGHHALHILVLVFFLAQVEFFKDKRGIELFRAINRVLLKDKNVNFKGIPCSSPGSSTAYCILDIYRVICFYCN